MWKLSKYVNNIIDLTGWSVSWISFNSCKCIKNTELRVSQNMHPHQFSAEKARYGTLWGPKAQTWSLFNHHDPNKNEISIISNINLVKDSPKFSICVWISFKVYELSSSFLILDFGRNIHDCRQFGCDRRRIYSNFIYDLYMLKRDYFVVIVGTAQWSLNSAWHLHTDSKIWATNSILYSTILSEHVIRKPWRAFPTCDDDGI